MNLEQKMVLEFHKIFNILINEKPNIVDQATATLRYDLIEEEFNEFAKAVGLQEYDPNLVAIADALGDLLYVVYGAAISYGIDMEPIFKEIHRSNMTKIGGYIAENGKLIKPSTYDPPKLINILYSQS